MRRLVGVTLALGLATIGCDGEIVDPVGDDDGGVTRDAARPRDSGPLLPGTDAGPRTDAGERVIEHVACPSYALLCESFEEGSGLDTGVWEIGDEWSYNGGRPLDQQSDHFVIDDAVSADGNRSLHLRMGGEYGTEGPQVFQNKVGLPASNDEIYVRLYMRFRDLEYRGAHPYFVSAVGADEQWKIYGAQVAFGTIWNEVSSNAFSRGLDYGLQWNESRDTLEAGEWFCLQIHAFGDDQGGDDTAHPNEEFRVAINGVDVPALLANDETWPDPPEHWSPFYDGSFWRFGFASANGANADTMIEYWIDAVAFANEPIPCDLE